MKEKNTKKEYLKIGLLNALERDILHAKEDNKGKDYLKDTEEICISSQRLLNLINKEVSLLPNSSSREYGYIIPNIELEQEDRDLFKKLVLDLITRNIISNKITSDTVISNVGFFEMIDGKNIKVTNRKELRKYTKKLEGLINEINNIPELIAHDSMMSRFIKVPNDEPVFSYDTKKAFYHKIKNKEEIKLKGLLLRLFVYFLNNPSRHIPEEIIEHELELSLRKTGEKRSDRATYKTIIKLIAELKKHTEKEVIRRVKNNNAEKTWVFEPKVLLSK